MKRTLSLAVGLVALSSVAWAHMWYPMRCCGGMDCARADKVFVQSNGDYLVHIGALPVVVPKGFLQLPSQDADYYICVYMDQNAKPLPRCFFVPTNM